MTYTNSFPSSSLLAESDFTWVFIEFDLLYLDSVPILIATVSNVEYFSAPTKPYAQERGPPHCQE